jgi:Fe-S oxidoreductase
MTRVKEELVLTGQVPAELQTALENSQRYGNPMGESPKKRADWAKDIKPPVPIMGEIKRPVDVLWFVGDYSSYHPKAQEVARAFVKVMRALKIDFGILGPEEMSDGDSQRMAGESGLFEWLARKNERALMKYEFKQIVTTDPHAYNALKNDYPSLGIEYPVMHYTQFLAECLDQLKPLLRKSVEALVTYHDPCYLGRVNGIYDEPRQLLRAIPGVIFVEMSHHLDDSLCCGGGGGGMWLDGFRWEKSESRLTEWRVREVVASRPVEDFMSVLGDLRRPKRGAVEAVPEVSILAVACPYEKPRFEDATKAVPEAKSLIVKDLAELLAESMGLL